MDDQQRARELSSPEDIAFRLRNLAQNMAAGNGPASHDKRAWQRVEELADAVTALRAAPEWKPIESAPEGRLVVVGWLDTEDSHFPENYEFDYLEDGLWAKHEDCAEHAFAVAPPGSKMPKEQPPYQWWLDLPAFPAARPQGVKDGR